MPKLSTPAALPPEAQNCAVASIPPDLASNIQLVALPSARKQLDRALLEKRLALAIANDLPDFYTELRSIAISSGTDSTRLAALEYLLNRLLGKPVEMQKHEHVMSISVDV